VGGKRDALPGPALPMASIAVPRISRSAGSLVASSFIPAGSPPRMGVEGCPLPGIAFCGGQCMLTVSPETKMGTPDYLIKHKGGIPSCV
jgi:hypothetical protein